MASCRLTREHGGALRSAAICWVPEPRWYADAMTSHFVSPLSWIAVATLLALATAPAAWLDNEISLLSQAMLHLIAVVIVSLAFKRMPAVVCTVAAVAASAMTGPPQGGGTPACPPFEDARSTVMRPAPERLFVDAPRREHLGFLDETIA